MIQRPRSENIFINLEGGDGCGKSTICSLLAETISAFELHTPLPPFDEYRKHLDSECDLTARYLFYITTLIEASREIEEKLNTGNVVCDRYLVSTTSHHKHMGVDIDLINVEKLPIVRPDIIICLLVSDKERKRRMEKRGESPSASMIHHLSLVQQSMAEESDITIDTSDITPEEVTQIILSHIT